MSDEVDSQCTDVSVSFQVRCTLDDGHEGKHQARTGTGALHSWGNKYSLEPDPIDDSETDDGSRCGVMDGKRGGPCILKQGHDSHHSTGYRTFPNRPPKTKPVVAAPTGTIRPVTVTCGMCGAQTSPDGKEVYTKHTKGCPHTVMAKVRKAKANRPGTRPDISAGIKPCPETAIGARRGESCVFPKGHKGRHRSESKKGVHEWDARSGTFTKTGTDTNKAKMMTKSKAPKAKNPRSTTTAASEDTESALMRAHRRKRAEIRATKASAKAKPPARTATYCDDRESPNGSTSRVCSLPPGHDGDHGNGVAVWPQLAAGTKKNTNIQTGRSAGLKSPPAAFVIKAAAVSPDKVRILGYRRHPITALWPLIEGEEFAELVASVKARGLDEGYEIELVKIDGETFILDGSNRGRACEASGVKPRFRQYTGKKDIETIRAYVDGRNAHRRHLTKSQLAMICAAGDRLCQGNSAERSTGKTQAERAKSRGLSERLQRKADFVQDNATPKVKQAVLAGKMSVEAAEPLSRLPVANQDELADRALAGSGEIKSGKVRALVNQAQKRAVVQKINKEQVHPMPIGPFRLIVVDPPWPYENADQHEGTRGHMPYPPMSIADICRLTGELDKLVHEEGSILGLWVTNAFIHEVGRVLEAWHFTHRTMVTWDKDRAGMGSWPRGQTEHLILASRGTPVHTLNEITTLFREAPREHSRKPDGLMEKLEQHCPGPFVELFSREPRPNWAAWGAETSKFTKDAAA